MFEESGDAESDRYVNIGATFHDCLTNDGPASDLDYDGLADDCESDVADAFGPVLVVHPDEYEDSTLTRETYWAARPIGNGSIKIFYALGYHKDPGRHGFTDHSGDSEFIVLTVRNAQRGFWIVDTVTMSAHWGESLIDRSMTVTSFRHRSGRPEIWVSLGKHANYVNVYECNNALLGHERCASSDVTTESVEVMPIANIGGQGMPLVNCTWSRRGAKGIECLWTLRDFGGWQDPRKAVTPYGKILDLFGFTPLPNRLGTGLLAALDSLHRGPAAQ